VVVVAALVLSVVVVSASPFGLQSILPAPNVARPVLQNTVTCVQRYCQSLGGSCNSNSSAAMTCNTLLYKNTTSGSCVCATPPTPTLGTACSISQGSTNSMTCITNSDAGQQNYLWYSKKTNGDTCSGVYDCLPPRVCSSSGQCTSFLNVGDTCYNSTTGVDRSTPGLGYCPVSTYCPKPASGLGAAVCTTRVGLGGTCTATGDQCLAYLWCDPLVWKCATVPIATLDAGAFTNNTYACKSGWSNTTSAGATYCLDYNTLLAAYKPQDGVTCSDDGACGVIGQCSCQASGTTAKCTLQPQSSPAEFVTIVQFSVTLLTGLSNGGCDTRNAYIPAPTDSNSGNCVARANLYSSYVGFLCSNYRAGLATGDSFDCGALSAYCGGAFKAASSLVVVAALMFLALLAPIM